MDCTNYPYGSKGYLLWEEVRKHFMKTEENPEKLEAAITPEERKMLAELTKLEEKCKVLRAEIYNTNGNYILRITKAQQAYCAELQNRRKEELAMAKKFWSDNKIDLMLAFSGTKGEAALQKVLALLEKRS